ncbi:MAG: HEAT repeat domain-containing protein [Patescibacteria group bacterium]
MASREQKEKWKKLLLLLPIFVAYTFGAALSGIVGRVLFVERVGADYLPYIYIVCAACGSLLTIFIAAMMKKISLAKLLQIFSWIGAALFFANYLLMKSGNTWVYTVFLVVSTFFYLILGGTVIWRLAGSLSTLFESKANFVHYASAYSLGGVLAGLASSLLEEVLDLEDLILLVCGSLVLAAINLIFLQSCYEKQLAPVPEEGPKVSEWNVLKKEFVDFRKTNLAKTLFVALTIFNVVWWISDFEFQKIAEEQLSEEEYVKISGYLNIATSLLLGLALLVQNKITKKAGVLNSLLLSPVLVFIPFLLLFLFPTPLFAFVVCLVTSVVGYSIFSNSSMEAYTALPNSIRNRVATFISGNSDATAMLVAGAGLAILTEYLANIWILGVSCVLLLINAGLFAYIRQIYLHQVLLNLGSTNQVDMHGAIENLAEEAYHEVGVQELMKLISWRNLDEETVRKIVFALGKINNIEVLPNLLEMFKKHNSTVKYSIVEAIHSFKDLNKQLEAFPFTRLNLIEAYEKIFLEEEDTELKLLILDQLGDFDPDKVITFLRNTVNDKNPEVSTRAISAMRFFHDRGIVAYVRPHLDSTDPKVQAAAIISIWQFAELKPLLMKYFVQIMSGSSRENVLATLNVIGSLGFTWEKAYAQKHLLSSDPLIKQMAALTLMQLNDEQAVLTVSDALMNKTSESLFFARALKKIPLRIKKLVLKRVNDSGEVAASTCVEILKSTYLNFIEEIEGLSAAKENFGFSR